MDPSPPAADAANDTADKNAHRPDNIREKKAARILDMLRVGSVEPETKVIQRTVDDAAPDLVKALDPDNAAWTPANGKWHTVSEFIKADLRRDAQSALRVSTAQTAQATAREYAARAKDADLDDMLAYLGTPDGTHYVAFQSELRPLLYDALAALQAQDALPEEEAGEVLLKQRKQLLSMALEYRISKDGRSPVTSELRPGSVLVAENAARREATALDALYAEYGTLLPALEAFTDSPTAQHFFVAVEPALRTERALSSTATTDFAEREFDRYLQRWRSIYGPPMRVSSRTTVSIRGRIVSIAHTTQMTINAAGSAEAMAIQCEQREYGAYQQSHPGSRDQNAQAAALDGIQRRCRAEQHLPAL